MQVRILGPLMIEADGADLPAGGRHQRRLLVRLAMDAGHAVSLADLEFATWGENAPPASRHTIATHVFRLRRLGLDICTGAESYSLESETDARELERLAAAARAAAAAGDRRTAARDLRVAVALSRGRPLAELDDLPEAQMRATSLTELIERLQEDLLEAEMEEGVPAEVAATARRLVDEQPYRENRWELLMVALYRSGRQAEALDAFGECRRRLLDDLGIEPGPSLRKMQQAVLAQDPSLELQQSRGGPPPTIVAPANGESGRARIPGTSTRLIGRVRERRDLAEVWDRSRLGTLVGPPGAGKTRLALETARKAGGPVWFVAIEPVPESQSVAAAILDVVAPSSTAADAIEGVAAAIGPTIGLLVLDGCEGRLSEVAGVVARLLGQCPGLRILTTSRERLGLLDEAIMPVGPLAEGDAIDLLVDRARLADPRFRLSPDQVAAADELCALLDRLPLGLELVARHLQLLGLEEVVARVRSDVGRWAAPPAGGRRGLWAAFDASVERLGAMQRQALLALAVMVADADLELIAAVAGFGPTEPDTFDAVAHLVDASLVQVRSGPTGRRYQVLRTLAVRTVDTAATEQANETRERYVDAVLDRIERLAAGLTGGDRGETVRLLDGEIPHLRAVLDRILGQPAAPSRLERGLETAVALSGYWLGRHPAEGMEWLDRLIDAGDPPAALRARALLAQSQLAYWLTDFARGLRTVDEARMLFAALGDLVGEAMALRRRGAIYAAMDEMPAARDALEASLQLLDQAGAEGEAGTTLLHLGSLLADEAIVDEARSVLDRALGIAVANGDPLLRGHVLASLSLANWKAGDLETALDYGKKALAIFEELGHRPTEGTVAYRLAAVARGLGMSHDARKLAQRAIAAGEQSSTRTTVALGHINLARLDLDVGDLASAASNIERALAALDPALDRWVLVEALEATARLLVAGGEPGAATLLESAAAIRTIIRQPVSPTEAPDLERTLARVPDLEPDGSSTSVAADPVAAHTLATSYLRALARSESEPHAFRRPVAET